MVWGPLGAGLGQKPLGRGLLVWGVLSRALGLGPAALGPGTLGSRPQQAAFWRRLLARPGGPLVREPLVGGPLTRDLGPGALGRGGVAREGGVKKLFGPTTKLSNQAVWTLASLLVQESSHQGPGGPRKGGPANPEPKTLNHLYRQRVTIWGYTLATLKVVIP